MSDASSADTAHQDAEARLTFSRLVAHALNGLVHQLDGALVNLRVSVRGDPVTEDQREYIEQASASSAQLLRLVEDIELLTHAAAGDMEIQLENTLLTTLLREAITQAQTPEKSQSAREIKKNLSNKFATIWCDEELTRRALAAIIENALRFSPADSPVIVYANKKGDWAVIRVHDQGTGVDPTIAKHVFEPLWSGRGRKNNVGAGLGLGLGLAVAHACITAQGGRLTLETASGPGTTFAIELPLAPLRAEADSR